MEPEGLLFFEIVNTEHFANTLTIYVTLTCILLGHKWYS